MSQVILQLFCYTVQLLNIQLDPTFEPDQVFPPPPHPFVDSSGGQRFLVARILNHRNVNGVRTSYLVRWRGYPPAWNSWEPLAQLIVDILGRVEHYDETHPLRLKKGRRKTTSPNTSTGTARYQSFGHLRRDVPPPVGKIREGGLPRGTVRIVQATRTRITLRETG
uniref:Chromo domain-containing protein n=1 Tax=Peronospora matthiolae TaxID=2874970 RepID=A0AAV1TX18_9STRA